MIIKLTKFNGTKVLLNTYYIQHITEDTQNNEHSSLRVIVMRDNCVIVVTETLDEIDALVNPRYVDEIPW